MTWEYHYNLWLHILTRRYGITLIVLENKSILTLVSIIQRRHFNMQNCAFCKPYWEVKTDICLDVHIENLYFGHHMESICLGHHMKDMLEHHTEPNGYHMENMFRMLHGQHVLDTLLYLYYRKHSFGTTWKTCLGPCPKLWSGYMLQCCICMVPVTLKPVYLNMTIIATCIIQILVNDVYNTYVE